MKNTKEKLQDLINNMEICYIKDFEGKDIILIKENGFLVGSMFVSNNKCMPTGIDILNRLKHKYFYKLSKFNLCLESIKDFEIVKIYEGGKLLDLSQIEKFYLKDFNLVLCKKNDDNSFKFDLNLISSNSLFVKYLNEYIKKENDEDDDFIENILDKYYSNLIKEKNNEIKQLTQQINKLRKGKSSIMSKETRGLYNKFDNKLMFLVNDIELFSDEVRQEGLGFSTTKLQKAMISNFFDSKEVIIENSEDIFRPTTTTIKLNSGEVRIKGDILFGYEDYLSNILVTADLKGLNMKELEKIKALINILKEIEQIEVELDIMCYSGIDFEKGKNLKFSKERNKLSESVLKSYLLGETNEI